jgi:hypothetical protein
MTEVLQAQALAQALAELPAARWVVVGGVDWPTPAVTAADHVLIGPGGVFVVIAVDCRDRPATVLLDAPWVDGEFRGDLVTRAAAAAAAVVDLVPGVDPDHVRPVLCLDQQTMVLQRCDEVTVCSTANLVSVLVSRTPVLDTRQVHTIHARLRAGIRRASAALRHVPAQPAGEAPRRPRTRVVVAAAVAAGLAVAGGVALAAADLEAPQHTAALVDAITPLGRPVEVAGAGGRLRVAVRDVRPVAGRDGRRLLAVELVLADLDRRPWTGDPARSLWLASGDGRPVRAVPARGRVVVPLGRELAGRTSVRRGHPVHGQVLVEMPAAGLPSRVELRLGDGDHGRAAWQVR